MKIRLIVTCCLIAAVSFTGMKLNSGTPVYKDPKAPIEKRVEDLLSKMTLEEKIDLLAGTGFATKPIERLGIPELRMADGPLGVRMGKATAFPSGIALAATWDPRHLEAVGSAIARETKGKGRHVILGPCVNIARIPQGGRNFESYGEDPFLTTAMTVPYIKGVQKENVVATVKHFALNNQEHERDFVDVQIDERSMHEIYFPAFKAAVKDADVWSFMCSYNKVNGHWASENDYLLLDILKKQWGFNYLVMSDWGAVHHTIPVAKGGLDLEMPDGKYLNRKTLLDEIKNGAVKESVIDDKVRRILRVIFKIGLFENPGKADSALVGTKENLKAAFEGARAGIVLLQNKNNILPLSSSKIKSIAVIGPNANALRAGGGGSSQVNPMNTTSPLAQLKQEYGSKIKFTYAEGVTFMDESVPVSESQLFTDETMKEHGLKGEYFSNMKLEGTPAFTRTDKTVNFNWGDGGPKEDMKNEFSVRWTGFLRVDKTGEYTIQTASDDGQRLWVDGRQVISDWTNHAIVGKSAVLNLEAGKLYSIKMEFYEDHGGAAAKLGWVEKGKELFAEAVNAAKNSDVALVFVGTTANIETEGKDRDDILLPEGQDKLIGEVAKVNKNVVVVITSGSPVLMGSWITSVKGVMETWFGGQEMSRAISDVLFGKYNPSGKLPVTFPVKYEDCSAASTYKAKPSVTEYTDGLYVGYRHFEKNNIKPLFPFGYGLSYTTFKYSGLKVTPKVKDSEKVKVTFTVANTGKVEGAEVAQLYLKDVKASVDRPVKELKGFSKVTLKPGEKKTITLELDKDDMSFFDPASKTWKAEAGDFEVLVGSSSQDIHLNGKFTLL